MYDSVGRLTESALSMWEGFITNHEYIYDSVYDSVGRLTESESALCMTGLLKY